MTATRHTLAAYIGVRNCPELLAECLGHLSWVDEIVVADASTDDRIARMLAAQFPRAKRYVDQTADHRIRMMNLVRHIQSDFILGLDADEFFTPDAGEEILRALTRPCPYDGFKLPSISYVFGECFGVGATQLRVFRRDRFRWLMQSPHEMVHVDGPVRELTQPYHHHNNPSLSLVPIKTFRYEAAQSRLLEDGDLDRLSLDQASAWGFWSSVILEWARMNVRFVRALRGRQGSRFTRLCLAYTQVFHVIARHVCRTEERRMRSGVITRDRQGYF